MFLILYVLGNIGLYFIAIVVGSILGKYLAQSKFPKITKEDLEPSLKFKNHIVQKNSLFLFNEDTSRIQTMYGISKLGVDESKIYKYIFNNFDFINSNYIVSISINNDINHYLVPPHLDSILDKFFKEIQ